MGDKVKIKIKKLHPNAVIPKYAHVGDAGVDLVATEVNVVECTTPLSYDKLGYVNSEKVNGKIYEVKFGFAIEFPKGYVARIYPRSSIYKTGLVLANSSGTIDCGYRGELMAKFYSIIPTGNEYKVGDRCAQLILEKIPEMEFEEVDELSETDRGTGGFGSTGQS